MRAAECVLRALGSRPKLVYLIAQQASLQSLERIAAFARLPSFKIQGRTQTIRGLNDTLKSRTPVELMVSVEDRKLTMFLVARWPSEADLGSMNLRWMGLPRISEEVQRWSNSPVFQVARTRMAAQHEPGSGHWVVAFTALHEETPTAISETTQAVLSRLEPKHDPSRGCLIAWTGTLKDVKYLGHLLHPRPEKQLGDLLAFGPAGVPEENVDRSKLLEMSQEIDSCDFSQVQLCFSGIEIRANNLMDVLMVVTRKPERSELVLDCSGDLPGEIREAVTSALMSCTD